MNKDKFLKLFSSNNKLVESSDTKIIFPKIPFYGKGGTISHIEETDDCYYKIIYNSNGLINDNKIPVPKKKGKNLKLLAIDYYDDLKKYLEKNEIKYMEYENSNYIPILSNKQFYCLTAVTALASLASLPFLFTTTYIGIVFGTISTFSLYMVYDIHKKDQNNKMTRGNFSQNYKELEKDLINYCLKNPKDKTKGTIYSKINKIDSSKELDLSLIKRLKKEEI